MVNTKTFWILYPLIVGLSMLIYMVSPEIQGHPLSILFYLLLIGGPEMYYLAIYTIPYFHWFFGRKPSVVQEIRSALLVYLVFLVFAIIVNYVLKNQGFIVTTALILPLVAIIMAFIHELIEYWQERKYLPK